MYRIVTQAFRFVLHVAASIVPGEMRDEWRHEWLGDLWRWTLEAANSSAPDARFALLTHTRDALRAAIQARFQSELGLEEVRSTLGRPGLCLALGVLSIVAVAIASRGFSVTRHLAAGVPYRDPHSVVVLAQGPPVFGIRLGFRDAETTLFRQKSKMLAGVAAYSWHTASVATGHGKRLVEAANVDSSFFDVLGVPVGHLKEDEVFVSYDFWRRELRGDRTLLGKLITIDGRPLRLAGVLPQNFTFLSEPIAIWTSRPEPATVVSPRRWYLNLRGVIARLKPGVTPESARQELRLIQTRGGLARRNFEMQATPIEDLVYRAFRSYAGDLATLLCALLAWAAVRCAMDRRAGSPAKYAARFWGFFVLKTALPMIALFFAILELTGASAVGLTGGDPNRGGPLLLWASFASGVVILIWAFRDQPGRCRVCLNRLRRPVRIGVPGQMLLETAGEEVMCPQGHGSVYTSASVLGADISDRWMSLDLELDDTAWNDDEGKSLRDHRPFSG